MNPYRIAALSSAMAILLGTSAVADDIEFQLDDGAPAHFHHASPSLIVRQGNKAIPIQDGLTPLDKGLKPINCLSAAGCLVTAKVWFSVSEFRESHTVSAYVDGVAMNPAPLPPSWIVHSAQQSAVVAQGMHTLQSQVIQQGAGGTIVGWNVEYAVYELK